MTGSLKSPSVNLSHTSKEEIQQEVRSNDGRKFEFWPEH